MSFVLPLGSLASHSTYDDGIRPFFYGWGWGWCTKYSVRRDLSRIQVFFFCTEGTRPSCFVYFLFSTRGFFFHPSSIRSFPFSLVVCPLLKTLCVCDAVWVTFFFQLPYHPHLVATCLHFRHSTIPLLLLQDLI